MNLKVSLLSGALTLTLMVLPTIVRTMQEALKAVPKSYREGAAGLGTTKWHTIRTILLPSAMPGLITSVILAIGRIVGESAALILVSGGSAIYMPRGISDSSCWVPVQPFLLNCTGMLIPVV